jgi:hypothetical protein
MDLNVELQLRNALSSLSGEGYVSIHGDNVQRL